MSNHQMFSKLKGTTNFPAWFPEITSNSTSLFHSMYCNLQVLQQQRCSNNSKYKFESADHNREKNRYIDILPFDHSRIVLGNGGDYINASLLSSPTGRKKYIAAQGPLPNTVSDFWQMVYEQNVPVIVMLTTETENGRVKCHRYWPASGESLKLADIIVSNTQETVVMDSKTTVRKIVLRFGGREQTVKMIHFSGWPDHQVSTSEELLDLIMLANHEKNVSVLDGPMVVHCSAGVGRTGTFCVVDTVIDYMQNGIDIDGSILEDAELKYVPRDMVSLLVNHFRKQRVHIVQSFPQYVLCYDTLLLQCWKWNQEES